MRWVRQLRPVTAALLALDVAVLLLLAPRALQTSHTAELLATPAAAVDPPSGNLAAARPRIDPGAFETPLFHASRHFFVRPVVTQPSTPPPPNYRFSGIMAIPNKPTIAMLVSNDAGGTVRVKTGDDLGGWRVQAIETRRVVLEHAGQTIEIAGAVRASPASRGVQRLTQR